MKTKAIGQPEFSKSVPGRGDGGALRSPVAEDAAGRALGERRLRLFGPLGPPPTPFRARRQVFNSHPKVGVHARSLNSNAPAICFAHCRGSVLTFQQLNRFNNLDYAITRRKTWNCLRRRQPTLHRLGHRAGVGAEGAKLAFTYQGDRVKESVAELAGEFGADTLILPCDVTKDKEIASVFKTVGEKFGRLHLLLHSVAFAPKTALEGEFVNTSREAFHIAHDVSAYSLVALARAAAPLMPEAAASSP